MAFSNDHPTYNLWYDGPDRKLSGIICLNKVAYIEVDDKEFSTLRDMELVDYNKFRIWKGPSWLRRKLLKAKWFFLDLKKLVKEHKEKKGSSK